MTNKMDIRFRDVRTGKYGLWVDGKKVTTAQLKFMMTLPYAKQKAEELKTTVNGPFMREHLSYSSTSSSYEMADLLTRKGFLTHGAAGWELTNAGYSVLNAAEIGHARGFIKL